MAAEKGPTPSHRGPDVAGVHQSLEEKYDEVRQLINIGKEKGYLLYDEVNELLPSEITSSDELDDLFNTFGSAGIEVIDSDQKYLRDDKVIDRTAEGAEELELDLTPWRARQDQRPGADVPPGNGHGSAAHARGGSRDRAPDRARQAGRDQVDLADAARRQAGHRVRRQPARRGAHHSRARDLQRRGDHRRAHRRAAPPGAEADRRGAESPRWPRKNSKRSSPTRPKGPTTKDKRKYRRARWAAMRARIELSHVHPTHRVHRGGQAAPDRRHEGRRRGRQVGAARDRGHRSPAEPEEQEAEAQGRRPQEGLWPAQGAEDRSSRS